MQANKRMENPTRKAKALAIRPWFDLAGVSALMSSFCVASLPPRIMKNKAEPRLPKIAKNAIATKIFMNRIIG